MTTRRNVSAKRNTDLCFDETTGLNPLEGSRDKIHAVNGICLKTYQYVESFARANNCARIKKFRETFAPSGNTAKQPRPRIRH